MPVRDYVGKAIIEITSTSHSKETATRQMERFLNSASQWFVKVDMVVEPELEEAEGEGNGKPES